MGVPVAGWVLYPPPHRCATSVRAPDLPTSSPTELSMPNPFADSMRLPVVAAPMFLVSGPELVIASCKSGVLGTFPALNQRTSEGFEEWLVEIQDALAAFADEGGTPAPFGVNLIVHRSNPRVQADLELIVKHEVPLVITSLGAVSDAGGRGALLWRARVSRRHQPPSRGEGGGAGVDGLICVCAGAGGHAGMLNPMPFVAEMRSFFDGTILLAGCLSTGRDVATAMQLGADLAYMGTRFINVDESRAPEDYRTMIEDSRVGDIVYTAAVSGVPANFMRPSLESVGITEEMWSRSAKVDFGKELDAGEAEAKAWKTVWSAGQGVTTIEDTLPVADLVDRLESEYLAALREQASRLSALG